MSQKGSHFIPPVSSITNAPYQKEKKDSNNDIKTSSEEKNKVNILL